MKMIAKNFLDRHIPIFLMDEGIVEFSVLVDHLERGCVVCHKPLNLAKFVKEKQYGLASLLYIKCTCCKELTCTNREETQH